MAAEAPWPRLPLPKWGHRQGNYGRVIDLLIRITAPTLLPLAPWQFPRSS